MERIKRSACELRLHGMVMRLIVMVLVIFSLVNAATPVSNLQTLQREAEDLLTQKRVDEAMQRLQLILTSSPQDTQALQLFGACLLTRGDYDKSIDYFVKALKSTADKKVRTQINVNYLEALRLSRRLREATQLATAMLTDPIAHPIDPLDIASLHLNSGLVFLDTDDYQNAYDVFEQCTKLRPQAKSCWHQKLELLIRSNNIDEAEKEARLAIELHPNDSSIVYLLGVVMHHRQRADLALEYYLRAERLNPNDLNIKSNIASALHILGRVDEAYDLYRDLIVYRPNDAGLLNNFGALLGIMGKKSEEIQMLKRALELDPTLDHALSNLAGYYQEDGLLDDARELLGRYGTGSPEKYRVVRLRNATMLSPVTVSWEHMVHERLNMFAELMRMKEEAQRAAEVGRGQAKVSLDAAMDNIHFYLPYHGLNDRLIQQLNTKVNSLYITESGMIMPGVENSTIHHSLQRESRTMAQILSDVSSGDLRKGPSKGKGFVRILSSNQVETVTASDVNDGTSVSALSSADSKQFNSLHKSKIRIGFISKFFGVFEPHAMLLDGAMQYLPRDHFTVVCISIIRPDGKPLASTLMDACDEQHSTSLIYQHTMELVANLHLSALIFADTVSEPMNHYLSQTRLAPIQLAFWGNPITSGSPTMDYFISSAVMEHPYLTRLMSPQEAYSEQLLLLEGQGIWYFRPIDPKLEIARVGLNGRVADPVEYTRESLNLCKECFLFLLPQSVFKIHPLFDRVLAEILRQNPTAQLVVTGGRRPMWTELYRFRLEHMLSAANVSADRLHILERVSSESFFNLLRIADAVLHPFPFDGSRTSADALHVHKPLLTLPSDALRGRMGLAFLRTMGLHELVAHDIEEYVAIASRLVRDKAFYGSVVQKISQRVDLIWEDMEFPYSLSSFFERLFSLPVHSYEEFLKLCKRDASLEKQRSQLREQYSSEFDRVWATQSTENNNWMLDKTTGQVFVDSLIDNPDRWPRLFEHWKQKLIMEGNVIPESPEFFFARNSTLRNAHQNRKLEQQRRLSHNDGSSSSPRSSNERPSGPEVEDRLAANRAGDHMQFQLSSGLKISAGPGSSENRAQSTSLPTRETHVSASTAVGEQGVTSTDAPKSRQGMSQASLSTRDRVKQFQYHLRMRDFASALPIAQQLFSVPEVRDDPMFLVEVAALQFFRGEYVESLTLCKQALQIAREPSVEMHMCVGAAATYVNGESNTAVEALLSAHELLLPMVTDRATGKVNRHLSTKALEMQRNTALGRPADETTSLITLDIAGIEGNLVTALESAKRYEECLAIGSLIFNVDLRSARGAHILAFATVNWNTTLGREAVDKFDERLSALLNISHPRKMMDEIEEFQQQVDSILNHLIPCYVQSQRKQYFVDASLNLLELMSAIEAKRFVFGSNRMHIYPQSYSAAAQSNVLDTTNAGIALITQYFDAADKVSNLDMRKTLQDDMNTVLIRNLLNPYIHEIYLLMEKDMDLSKFPQQHKIKKYFLGRRMMFRDALLFADQQLHGRTVAIANADIYFDTSIRRLFSMSGESLLKNNTLLALLKWVSLNNTMSIPLRTDSQDAWIFKSPLTQSPILKDVIEMEMDIPIGAARCDNRLAFLFSEVLNYTVVNPVLHVHAIEIQRSSRPPGILYSMKGAAVGEGMNVPIAETLHF